MIPKQKGTKRTKDLTILTISKKTNMTTMPKIIDNFEEGDLSLRLETNRVVFWEIKNEKTDNMKMYVLKTYFFDVYTLRNNQAITIKIIDSKRFGQFMRWAVKVK